jgi:hypothetical protein
VLRRTRRERARGRRCEPTRRQTVPPRQECIAIPDRLQRRLDSIDKTDTQKIPGRAVESQRFMSGPKRCFHCLNAGFLATKVFVTVKNLQNFHRSSKHSSESSEKRTGKSSDLLSATGKYPGLKEHICDDQHQIRFVNVFLLVI